MNAKPQRNWTFSCSVEFRMQWLRLPPWRADAVRNKILQIEKSPDPLILASRKGRIARFPFGASVGSIIIARVDDEKREIVFLKLQNQQ